MPSACTASRSPPNSPTSGPRTSAPTSATDSSSQTALTAAPAARAKGLTRLRRIRDLLGEGFNLAGITIVLQLETENDELQAEMNTQI